MYRITLGNVSSMIAPQEDSTTAFIIYYFINIQRTFTTKTSVKMEKADVWCKFE